MQSTTYQKRGHDWGVDLFETHIRLHQEAFTNVGNQVIKRLIIATMYQQIVQQSMQEAHYRHREGNVNLPYPPAHSGVHNMLPPTRAALARPPANPTSTVLLNLACRNLVNMDVFSKSDPMVVVLIEKRSGNSSIYEEIGRTEIIKNNLNPDFTTPIKVAYYFEELQRLKFEVYDSDSSSANLNKHDFIGRAVCSLGSIMGESCGRYEKDLEKKSGAGVAGKIIIAAEEMSACKDLACMELRGKKLDKKDFFGLSDPFLVFYRSNEDNSYTAVHKTEVIKNTLNPTWKAFKLPLVMLCNGDYSRTIKIECYDWDSDGSHDLIGEMFVDINLLKSNQHYTSELINPKKKSKKKGYKNSGHLEFASFGIEAVPSFLDFIKGGTELCFSVAIDFTASNGDPSLQTSLHFNNPYQPNDYIKALTAVGKVCQDYDTDKWFPALGFGAQIPPRYEVSHQFSLNGTENPNCHMVDGIIQAYLAAIKNVRLYGPTNFAPIINQTAIIASQEEKSNPGRKYFILLILTDGVISDLDQTKRAIVEASYLPMSIIIVGIGPAKFDAMEELDADREPLSYRGKRAQRDIVQFVPFRNFSQHGVISGESLAKAVLAEVPEQFLSYMSRHKVKPGTYA